jgi:DNA-binding Xre family transcriptional regulator
MAKELDYEWRLRILLAEKGIFSSKPLVALLAEHGIRLSDSQVWRLVTGKPERLSLQVLVVLCNILDCTPNDLIRPAERSGRGRLERRSAAQAGAGTIVPKRAQIRGAKRDG